MASKVYFLNDRANTLCNSMPVKGVKVLRDAGIRELIKPGDKVGVKVHMGSWGNTSNLRPQLISFIVDEIKRLGGKPEVFDGSVLLGGARSDRSRARDHLITARRNGFTEETMGCPVVISDGEFGQEDVECEVPNGVYLKRTYMGKHTDSYDKVVVVSHFKGHAMGVYGGAIKNVGIGMASWRGRQCAHFVGHREIGYRGATINDEFVKMKINEEPHPNYIERLVRDCPGNAFKLEGDKLTRDPDKCMLCSNCFMTQWSGVYDTCPDLPNIAPIAIADSAGGIINRIGPENMIFVNFAIDIIPGCDCCEWADRPMLNNFGVLASKDPVALDMACVEMAEAQYSVEGSLADDYGFTEPNSERFTNVSSAARVSQWEQINSGAFNGYGTTEYILVRSKDITPNEDADFWHVSYTPENTYQQANKEHYMNLPKGIYEVGDFSYDYKHPRMSIEECSKKPVGKVGEEELD